MSEPTTAAGKALLDNLRPSRFVKGESFLEGGSVREMVLAIEAEASGGQDVMPPDAVELLAKARHEWQLVIDGFCGNQTESFDDSSPRARLSGKP